MESNNEQYAIWANDVLSSEFYVLQSISVNEFWNSLLISENRERATSSYQELKFKHTNATDFTTIPTKKKEKALMQETKLHPRPQRSINEDDDVFVEGLDCSLGSFIGTLAHNSTINDRKSRYFVTAGMNGIIDISDESPGSQIEKLSQQTRQSIKERLKFDIPKINYAAINQFEKYMSVSEKKYVDYLRKTIQAIRYSRLPDPSDIISDFYLKILKLHTYSPKLFDEEFDSLLSEGDHIVKVWGELLEIVFRSCEVTLHWGDTISPTVMATGTQIKMDLRIIKSFFSVSKAKDISSTEFAKNESESKFYRDLLKVVMSSKIHLNNIVQDLTEDTTKNVIIPFCIVTGLSCYVYSLRLTAKNLYIVEEVCRMSVPSSLKELKEHGISDFLQELLILKEICLNACTIISEKEDASKIKKRKMIKRNKVDPSNIVTTPNDWCKPIWLPPPMVEDENELD